jgi:hypothetical protein
MFSCTKADQSSETVQPSSHPHNLFLENRIQSDPQIWFSVPHIMYFEGFLLKFNMKFLHLIPFHAAGIDKQDTLSC